MTELEEKIMALRKKPEPVQQVENQPAEQPVETQGAVPVTEPQAEEPTA
jgi:hypothetical protein